MANYKKKVRTAMVAALSHATTGFNAKLAAIATSYSIVAFALDFTLPSANVVYGYMDDAEVSVSQVFDFPGAIIYSTESVIENKVKFSKFSGFVDQNIAIYLRYRKYDDSATAVNQPDFDGDYEKFGDAVEDAMNETLVLGRAIMAPLGVNHTLTRVSRSPIQSLGDGHVQVITFILGFEVHV